MESVTDGRRQRSDRSRRQITEAAGRLFVERGYVPTTIEEIAGAAGVSAQTVYYGFGTKVRILSAVLDARIAGDLDRPVVDLDWAESLGSAGSPADAIDAARGGGDRHLHADRAGVRGRSPSGLRSRGRRAVCARTARLDDRTSAS